MYYEHTMGLILHVHASISHTNLIKKKEMTRSSASLQHNCTSSGVHCHPCIPVLAPSEKHDDETGITELFVFRHLSARERVGVQEHTHT